MVINGHYCPQICGVHRVLLEGVPKNFDTPFNHIEGVVGCITDNKRGVILSSIGCEIYGVLM